MPILNGCLFPFNTYVNVKIFHTLKFSQKVDIQKKKETKIWRTTTTTITSDNII